MPGFGFSRGFGARGRRRSSGGTPTPTPTAPAQIGLVTPTPGDGEVALTWTAPADGGSPITDYVVQYKLSSSGTWLTFTDGVSATTGAVVTGLTNASAYDFRVAAKNVIDTGLPSDPVSETPEAGAVIPANLIYDATAKQFVITNAAAFPGAVYVWKDELGNVIAGQTASVMPESAQPDGRYVQAIPDGITAAASNEAISAVVLSGFVDEIEATDGTLLTALSGWSSLITWSGASPATDAMEVRSGRLRQTKVRHDTSLAWKRTGIPVGDKIMTFENTFDLTQADVGGKYGRTFRVEWVDGNNFVSVSTNSGHLAIQMAVQGSFTNPTIGGDNLNVFVGKSTLSTKRVGDRLRVYADSVEVPRSVALGGFDITGAPKTSVLAWGPNDNQGIWNYPVSHFDRLTVTGVLAKEFNVVSVTDIPPNGTYPDGAVAFVGTCTPGITNYDWSMSRADGSKMVDWTANIAVTSDGNWSFTWPLPVELAGTSGGKLRLRVSADPTMMTTYNLLPLPAFYPMARTIWGGQASNVGSSTEEDIYTNREPMVWWVQRRNNAFVNTMPPNKPDGSPDLDAVPAGEDVIVAKIWEGSAFTGYGRGGTYQISWEMDNVTAVWGLNGNSTARAITGPKTATVTIPEMTASGTIALYFTRTGGSVGSTRISIVRVGETSTGPINDKALASFAPGSIYRYMKSGNVEGPRPLGDDLRATPELVGLISNQTGTKPWVCMQVDATDEVVLSYATRLKSNINAGVPIYPEVCNELWNPNPYWPVIMQATALALKDGTVAGVAAGTDWVNSKLLVGTADAYTNSSTGQVLRTIPAGTFMLSDAAGSKTVALEALQDIPPGTIIPNELAGYNDPNGYFHIHAGMDALATGKDIWHVKRTGEVKAIFKSVFGASNPIISVWGIQKGRANSDIKSILMSGPAGAEYGRGLGLVSPSHYIAANNDWVGPFNLAPTWMKTPSNQAAWLSNFNTYVNGLLPGMIAQLVEHKKIHTLMRQAGWSAEESPLVGTYEGDLHFRLDHVPAGADQTNVTACLTAWLGSANCYNFTKAFLEGIDPLGLHCVVDFAFHKGQIPGESNDYFGWKRGINTENDPVTGAMDQKWIARQDFLTARGGA